MDTRKNKGISGAGLLVLVVFLFAVLWFTNMFENQSDRLTWSEFQTLVTGDNVDSISVIQNKNVPTGHVEIKLKKEDKDGKQVRYLYVSDINEVQDYPVSYTHLRAHETGRNLVCRLLLEKKKTKIKK